MSPIRRAKLRTKKRHSAYPPWRIFFVLHPITAIYPKRARLHAE